MFFIFLIMSCTSHCPASGILSINHFTVTLCQCKLGCPLTSLSSTNKNALITYLKADWLGGFSLWHCFSQMSVNQFQCSVHFLSSDIFGCINSSTRHAINSIIYKFACRLSGTAFYFISRLIPLNLYHIFFFWK